MQSTRNASPGLDKDASRRKSKLPTLTSLTTNNLNVHNNSGPTSAQLTGQSPSGNLSSSAPLSAIPSAMPSSMPMSAIPRKFGDNSQFSSLGYNKTGTIHELLLKEEEVPV